MGSRYGVRGRMAQAPTPAAPAAPATSTAQLLTYMHDLQILRSAHAETIPRAIGVGWRRLLLHGRAALRSTLEVIVVIRVVISRLLVHVDVLGDLPHLHDSDTWTGGHVEMRARVST